MELQRGKLIVSGYNPDDLGLAPVSFCQLPDTESFLLAAASPARTELKKYRHALVILRPHLPPKCIRQRKLKLILSPLSSG